jgi:phosphoribosylglycinamide formyltransferase-1
VSGTASGAVRPVRPHGPVGVLISGRGSNLHALIGAIEDGRLDARIAVVISNRTDAPGLEYARRAGIEALVVDHRQYKARADFDRTIEVELKARGVALVCLAGFMRLLGAELLQAFPDAVLNVHPSLLPAFPGVEAQQPGDTVESLSARILAEEHRIYPEAVRLMLSGAWRVEGRRFTTAL